MSFMLGIKTSSVLNKRIITECCVKKCFWNKTNVQVVIGRLVNKLQFSTTSLFCNKIVRSTFNAVNRNDINCTNTVIYKYFSETVDSVNFENICAETLDSLCEWFEDLIDKTPDLKTADVTFGDGVLTVNLGKYGTYVINRQSPNKQIWLSSPTSGPKRYDFAPDRKGWVYRHDNQTLHHLLQTEISVIIKSPVDLSHCAFFSD